MQEKCHSVMWDSKMNLNFFRMCALLPLIPHDIPGKKLCMEAKIITFLLT